MKLGIVGSGMIVRDLLSFIHTVDGIDLIHISGTKRSEDQLQTIMNEHGFKRYSIQYDELLNDQEVDTVYVALPNHLHFEYAKQALLANKNVILEKPLTSTYKQACQLKELAIQNHLFLWEAITNQYLPHFHEIKQKLKDIGKIKIVQCNYSQYSSRYNAFKEGNILPAFDYTKSGGALMDLNIYNIHFVVGLFGKPTSVQYYPNIENNIDTSGILILSYPTFQCVCIGAKDCKAPLSNTIQGDLGVIHIQTPVSTIVNYEVLMNNHTKYVSPCDDTHRMYYEFQSFVNMHETQDYNKCYKMLEHSMIVAQVQTEARRKAGIVFPDDQKNI